jgi:hypothetical protein
MLVKRRRRRIIEHLNANSSKKELTHRVHACLMPVSMAVLTSGLGIQHLPYQLGVEGRHVLQRQLAVRAHGQHPVRRPVGRRRLRRRGGALREDRARGRRGSLVHALGAGGGGGALLVPALLLARLGGAVARQARADGLDLGVDGVAQRAEALGAVVAAVHDAGEVEARVLSAEPEGGAVVGVRGGLRGVVGAEPDAHPVLRQPDFGHPLAPLPLPHAAVQLLPQRGLGGGGRRRAGEVAQELALAVVDAGAERRDGDRRREVGEDGVEGAAGGGEQQGGHGGADRAGEAAGRRQRAEAGVHG